MDDFGEIERCVQNAAGEELDTLITRSQDLKNMRAYLLPRHEIEAQGKYVIAELREWSVPQSVLKSIEDDFLNALQKNDLDAAPAALYNIFDSSDYWNMYIDWFTGFMRYIASILMGLMLLGKDSRTSVVAYRGSLFAAFIGNWAMGSWNRRLRCNCV
jgi:hypothetical protein